MTHAFCVVDDLLFDSICPYALKLTMDSVKWIFNDEEVNLHIALRFEHKYSPPGILVETYYVQPVTLHGVTPLEKKWMTLPLEYSDVKTI